MRTPLSAGLTMLPKSQVKQSSPASAPANIGSEPLRARGKYYWYSSCVQKGWGASIWKIYQLLGMLAAMEACVSLFAFSSKGIVWWFAESTQVTQPKGTAFLKISGSPMILFSSTSFHTSAECEIVHLEKQAAIRNPDTQPQSTCVTKAAVSSFCGLQNS